jgi:hypothetical protein
VFDKRRHYRNSAYRNALLLILNSDEGPIDCRVIDSSSGGVKLLAARHVSVGSIVEILIGDETTLAEVRHSAPRAMGQCELGLLKRTRER